ncbi:sirohydrochlorin chelatase, partial [Calditerricola satsumensis]
MTDLLADSAPRGATLAAAERGGPPSAQNGCTAVLFVGHGSRDPEGNAELLRFTAALTPRLPVPVVETCFLELTEPTIAEGIARCVGRGAAHVVVVPISLFAAGHAKLHIPAALDEARERYPTVRFTYARPVGVHDKVLAILLDRLREAGFSPGAADLAETAVLVVGRGSSDPDANSDLFKISRLLWERTRVGWVETAFAGITAPLLAEGLERCVRLGARRVYVLPYFLFTGVLIKRMADEVAAFAARHPERRVHLARYFGLHPLLADILIERAQEALAGEVRMSCDLCTYRLLAAAHASHDPHHHHHHHHHHDPAHGHRHAHAHGA